VAPTIAAGIFIVALGPNRPSIEPIGAEGPRPDCRRFNARYCLSRSRMTLADGQDSSLAFFAIL
jgi:hypothetical protein